MTPGDPLMKRGTSSGALPKNCTNLEIIRIHLYTTGFWEYGIGVVSRFSRREINLENLLPRALGAQ